MSEEKKVLRDPATFRKASEPHPTRDDGIKALEAYSQACRDARATFRVVNVLRVVEVCYLDANGEEVNVMALGSDGDSSKMEGMAAYAYGILSEERRKLHSRLLRALREGDDE